MVEVENINNIASYVTHVIPDVILDLPEDRFQIDEAESIELADEFDIEPQAKQWKVIKTLHQHLYPFCTLPVKEAKTDVPIRLVDPSELLNAEGFVLVRLERHSKAISIALAAAYNPHTSYLRWGYKWTWNKKGTFRFFRPISSNDLFMVGYKRGKLRAIWQRETSRMGRKQRPELQQIPVEVTVGPIQSPTLRLP